MAKILDLDAILPEAQFVRLDGIDHPISVTSVEMYLQILKQRDKLDVAEKQNNEYAQTILAIDMIIMAAPSLKKERLMKLPLQALLKLTQLIESQLTEQAEEAGAANDAGE